MRIIAGDAKGTRLEVPKGKRVRPTLDRVREALFSVLAPSLPGASFLDLFAGTGANGIEALSRGAAHCTFVDNEPRCLDLVRRNLEAAHLEERASLRRLDLPNGLKKPPPLNQTFDIIFADPPHSFLLYEPLLETIADLALLKPDGVIVIEHSVRLTLSPSTRSPFECVRRATYGETTLSFFA